MKKCVIIPDSFKGTLSSAQICQVVKEEALRFFPGTDVLAVPVADGGEGTVDCFLAAVPGEKVSVKAHGPFGEPVLGYYGRFGEEAVLEMAMFAGLSQAEGRENPELASTYGVGEAIRQAILDGCTHILLGLGGSCTNDGGAGMAAALGYRFLDAAGESFVPTGGRLKDIAAISAGSLHNLEPLLCGIRFTAICDIDNPLCGPEGAAAVFAPQKGADAAMVERLDAGLCHLAEVLERDLGIQTKTLPGAGAAGGMGAGVAAFLKGQLRPGIQAVLDQVKFEELAVGADLVITGEGRLDSQSLHGKAVIGVAERAAAMGIPVVAIVGDVGKGADEAYGRGVTAIQSISRRPIDFSISRKDSLASLRATAGDLFRLWRAAEKGR